MFAALRWALAAPAAALGTLVILGNYGALVESYLRNRYVSMIPLIGGVSLAIALLACPSPAAARRAWVPLVVDPGCGLALMFFGYSLLLDRKGTQ